MFFLSHGTLNSHKLRHTLKLIHEFRTHALLPKINVKCKRRGLLDEQV